MQLSFLDDMQDFQQNGFSICRSCFSFREAQFMAQEIESLHQDYELHHAKTSALRRLGEWCLKNPHLASQKTHAFFLSEPYEKITKTLIGSDVDLYWATTACKPALTGKNFPWHQDVGYEEDPRDYITCWAAFDFVDPDNGCLWAIPGSHNWPILTHEFRKQNENDYGGVFIKSVDFDESLKVPLRLEPGDIAVMHSRLVHCTFKNQSLRKRRGVISAFGSARLNPQTHIRGYEEAPVVFLRKGQRL